MKKGTAWLIILFWSLLLLSVQGCASNKSLVKKDFSPAEPIKVCRHETPGIMKSTGTETALMAMITLAAPGGSAMLVIGDEYEKLRGVRTQSKIPDFGSVLMNKFVERLQIYRPDWPAMVVIQDPVKEKFSEKCAVIEFKVNRVAYGSIDLTRGGIILERGLDKGVVSKGFLSKATATMKDSEGEVLWQKSFIYLSEDYSRDMSIDELEADDFMLLKDEIEFAAETTAADFIEHLNGETKEIAKK